jgi:uncharacterized protein (DUF924 family)
VVVVDAGGCHAPTRPRVGSSLHRGSWDAHRDRVTVQIILFWLPLVHSEDLALHELSVRHAEEEAANAPPDLEPVYEFMVSQAKVARSVIESFGRHPHRNEILGRTSTPEELEYRRIEMQPHLRQPPF